MLQAKQEKYGEDTDYLSAMGAVTGIDCFDAWTRELVETACLRNGE